MAIFIGQEFLDPEPEVGKGGQTHCHSSTC